MTTTTETVLSSTPIVRKPAEETNGEKPQQRSADWENPRVASILSAAAKCFARKGFTATTLAEIGKELGLRKSIVHYYFASKAALIHEVQSYTYHRYLDRLREAIKNGDGSVAQTTDALRALWDAVQNNKTGTGLNIEVWSAARRDVELKRRAAGLHRGRRSNLRPAQQSPLAPVHLRQASVSKDGTRQVTSVGALSRRRCRSACKSVGLARGWLCRHAKDAAGRDGRRPAPQ